MNQHKTLPKRKNTRLKNYNYNRNGAYFITICTKNHKCIFADIIDNKFNINRYGLIAEKHIKIISTVYEGVIVDKYVIMPNHIHMIITLCRERIAYVLQDSTKSLIPKIIQSFKSSVTKEIKNCLENKEYTQSGTHKMRSLQSLWQKSFHDHIIRSEIQYQKIWLYIDTNPQKWLNDCYNPFYNSLSTSKYKRKS